MASSLPQSQVEKASTYVETDSQNQQPESANYSGLEVASSNPPAGYYKPYEQYNQYQQQNPAYPPPLQQMYDHASAQLPAGTGVTAQNEATPKILGLRRTTFVLTVLLIAVIIAAAVGGGVGGSMAVQSAKEYAADSVLYLMLITH